MHARVTLIPVFYSEYSRYRGFLSKDSKREFVDPPMAKQSKAPVPLYEFEQEECRTAKKLTSWQFLTIRLLVSSAHNYS